MKKIFSRIDNSKLLHIFFALKDFQNERQDIVDPKEFIQVATLALKKNQTFKPHQHIWKDIRYNQVIAQESWVVIKGSVMVDYYDIDGKIIENVILAEGDCTITLEGGHNYKSLEDKTLVYEFKTGPYKGIENDKTFI